MRQQLEQLTQEKAEATQQQQALQQEKLELQQQLEQFTKEKAEATQQQEALHQNKQELRQQLEQSRHDFALLSQQQLEQSRHDFALLKQEKAEAIQQSEVLQQEKQRLQQQVEQLRHDFVLASKQTPTERKLVEVARQLSQLKEHCDAVVAARLEQAKCLLSLRPITRPCFLVCCVTTDLALSGIVVLKLRHSASP